MLERAVVCGTEAHPASDDAADLATPLTPSDFGFFERDAPFAPKEIAARLRVSSDEILGLIESGTLAAFPVRIGKRTTYRVPWRAIAAYFFGQQGSMN